MNKCCDKERTEHHLPPYVVKGQVAYDIYGCPALLAKAALAQLFPP